jgi:hypothetical protein
LFVDTSILVRSSGFNVTWPDGYDATWYAPTSFRLLDSEDRVIERYVSDVPGRGMQFQADEIERLVAAGSLAGDILPPEESVAIMQTLDTIRGQIGLRYPGE